MAMNFPNNPANGDVFQDYVYDSASGWRSQVMVGAAPCGSIMPFAGSTIPAGWLLCNGQAVSRTTYSSLFAALGGISSPWGLGNGSTTFNVPDLRKRVPVGKGDSGTLSSLGAIGGAETMSLSEAHIAAHTHSFSATTSNSGDHQHAPPVAVTYGGNAGNYRSVFATNSPFWSGGDWNNAVTGGGNHSHTLSGTTGTGSGSGSAFGLLQPYAVVNYIIKFSAVVAATDTEIAVRMGQAEATVTTQANIVSGYNSRLTVVEQPGRIIQVISAAYTTAYSANVTSNTFYDFPSNSLRIAITPKNANSKFLLMGSATVGTNSNDAGWRFTRNGSMVGVGNANSNRPRATALTGWIMGADSNHSFTSISSNFLDSPGTTSEIVYNIQYASEGGVVYINRSGAYSDGNAIYNATMLSSLTVLEIAG